jgi:hypothetical protein
LLGLSGKLSGKVLGKKRRKMKLNSDHKTMCYLDILDRLALHRKAVAFVARSLELDNNDTAAANLHLVKFGLEETEELLNYLIQQNIEQQKLSATTN